MSDSTIHKLGTDDGWHGVIAPGSQFPPEKGRYHLYIGKPEARNASCSFRTLTDCTLV